MIGNCITRPPTCCFTYDYDAASRVSSISREGGTVVYFAYDAADRLTRATTAQGHATYFAYNAANWLAKERGG